MTDQSDSERIRQLDTLLLIIDSPKAGDEVSFTMEGSTTKYRGIIKKSARKKGATVYDIEAKTYPAPRGTIDTIEYKGRIFRIGGWKKI